MIGGSSRSHARAIPLQKARRPHSVSHILTLCLFLRGACGFQSFSGLTLSAKAKVLRRDGKRFKSGSIRESCFMVFSASDLAFKVAAGRSPRGHVIAPKTAARTKTPAISLQKARSPSLGLEISGLFLHVLILCLCLRDVLLLQMFEMLHPARNATLLKRETDLHGNF